MKILITGASGFIGSFIVEEALKRGFETWAAVRKSSSKAYLQDERINFILAAYNAGPGHVDDARALAQKYGKNPNVWLGNVDAFVLKMSDAQYYNQSEVKYGYFRGSETYDYVNSIRARWSEYKKKIKH